MGEVTSEKARERVCVSDHAQRSTGQAGFRRKQTKSETWLRCSAVINNSETHASLCLSSLKKYIPSLMNVVKVTWPRKKGSKMIDIRFRCVIIVHGWSPRRERPEDFDNYLLLEMETWRSLLLVAGYPAEDHSSMNNEWTLHWMVKTWPEDKYNLLGVLLEWSPAKIIIPGSDYID